MPPHICILKIYIESCLITLKVHFLKMNKESLHQNEDKIIYPLSSQGFGQTPTLSSQYRCHKKISTIHVGKYFPHQSLTVRPLSQIVLSYWASGTFQGRTVKLLGGTCPMDPMGQPNLAGQRSACRHRQGTCGKFLSDVKKGEVFLRSFVLSGKNISYEL